MQSLAQMQPEPPRPEFPRHDLVRRRLSTIVRRGKALLGTRATFFVAPFLLGIPLAAQTPTTQAPATTQPATQTGAQSTTHPARTHRKHAAAEPAAQPVAALLPAPPVAPQIPDWPVNNKPADASVVWDSHGLFIQAANSSLDQILRDVSLKTGAKVEGMAADERIFGIYGPGPAREVLSQLLDGSGYNVLMVGDQGEGAPRRIVLSGRPKGPTQPSGNGTPGAGSGNDTENDQEPQQMSEQEPPQPGEQPRPGTPEYNAAQPVPVRTPQQMMQQMQQIQQPQPPPNNPQ